MTNSSCKLVKQAFDLDGFFEEELVEHQAVAKATHLKLKESFKVLVGRCKNSLLNGGKLILFGNGGSAADAQHLATEFTVRYRTNRRPLAALALTTDTSTLTAIGNDFGFESLFSRQLQALAKPEDMVIAITTSGKSPNIIEALKMAKNLKVPAAALTGGMGGDLQGLADPLLIVPSQTTSRIQEMHILLGQMLCGALEYELDLI